MVKKFHIKTYGCQMNVYDSERMMDVLDGLGYENTNQVSEANLIILNTCHIREKAAEKIYSEIGRLMPYKQRNEAVIGIAGCVAQAEGAEIFKRAPAVDFIVGPQNYHQLPDLLQKAELQKKPRLDYTDFPIEDKFDHLPQARSNNLGGVTAFLTIQEGCDKFCSFCVVPYTRGAEASRPAKAIFEEAKRLVDQGVCEITLLGQNVNAWRAQGVNATTGASLGQEWGLGALLNGLSSIDGLYRLRYTTSHPLDVDDDLINAHGQNPKVMPYLHLPVQSGSDKILHAMNRKHDAALYYDIVAKLRQAQPNLALTSDFIVGYPGETDDDFAATLKLVREIGFAASYSFKYSIRPGTPAAAQDQVPEAMKDERLQTLQQLLSAQQDSFNQAMIGKETEILLEKKGRYDGQIVGRSPWLQPVHIDCDEQDIGKVVKVKIHDLKGFSLFATPIEDQNFNAPHDSLSHHVFAA